MQAPAYDCVLPAPFGAVGIRTANGKVTEIRYLPRTAAAVAPRNSLAERAAGQIGRYLKDAAYRFDLPLEIAGTPYQQRVWQVLLSIPSGALKTYGEVSSQLRSSPRAVGQACGANRLPIVIPCHRVIAATDIGGFAHHTEGYLIATKRWLLAHEGAPLA